MKSFLCIALLLIFLPAPFSFLRYVNLVLPEAPKIPTSLVAALPRMVRRVVVDAGHGGKDFGAVSPWGIKEKELVLEVAKLVRDELRENGIQVIMTRTGDRFIPLSRRARIANKKDTDLFISIHANAALTPSLKGFEIYYLSDAGLALARTNESIDGLEAVLWDLKESENRKEAVQAAGFIQSWVENSIPVFANRLREANFYVLKRTESPAILIELGYLTNQEDAARLESPEYKKKLAEAIVGGILNYKFAFERTNGFSK